MEVTDLSTILKWMTTSTQSWEMLALIKRPYCSIFVASRTLVWWESHMLSLMKQIVNLDVFCSKKTTKIYSSHRIKQLIMLHDYFYLYLQMLHLIVQLQSQMYALMWSREFICSSSSQAVCGWETLGLDIHIITQTSFKPETHTRSFCSCHARQNRHCLFTSYLPSVLYICQERNTHTAGLPLPQRTFQW